jgi:hypothetical protein
MNIGELVPQPQESETFRRNRCRYVPESAGCYVLTTFLREVLYIGLTNNLRRRMNEHLDNPHKTAETATGRAVLFHWIANEGTNKIERTWLNIHIQNEGRLPVLNNIYSPVST